MTSALARIPVATSTVVSLLVVSSITIPSAAAVGVTDYSSRAPTSIALPGAGGSYVDPVFGTTIIRVTDAGDGTHCVHAYSYWAAFNLDNTRLLLACDDVPRLYRFDPKTDRLMRDGRLTGDDGVEVEFEGASWSNSDPNAIYALAGTRLYQIDVSRRGMEGYRLIRDFAGLFAYSFRLAQLQMSADDQVFTFHSRNRSTGEKLDVVAYDRATGKVHVYERGTWKIDESKIDKLGRYVLIDGSDANPGYRLWDFRSGAEDRFDWGDPDDKPGGHVDMGRTLMVNSDGWNTGLIVRRYDAMHGAANIKNIVQYFKQDGSLNWSIADHVSFRALDESFVVGSTYGGSSPWDAFEDEIYLAYVDGSRFVRLAHARSKVSATSDGWSYYAEPRAVVDRLGRYVVFTSNLGSSSRLDVMLLKIPSSLWPSPEQPDDGDAGGEPDAGTGGPPDAGRTERRGSPDAREDPREPVLDAAAPREGAADGGDGKARRVEEPALEDEGRLAIRGTIGCTLARRRRPPVSGGWVLLLPLACLIFSRRKRG